MSNEKLNNELLDMAVKEFSTFCALVGLDLTHAYICLLKHQGRSYGEIAAKLGLTKSKVRGIYQRNCDCKRSQ